MPEFLSLAGGIILLVIGGTTVIQGSANVARLLRLSPFFVGVVILGFGTSMPEMFASVGAAWHDVAGLAYGNVVGSNIANLILILAGTAVVRPILVSDAVAARGAPILFGLMAVFVVISLFLPLGRFVALVYLVIMGVYIWSVYRQGQATAHLTVKAEVVYTPEKLWRNIGVATLGLVLLVVGADILISAASELARSAGMSETVIGLTIVAVGTSMPELVSSALAARKGDHSMALGTIIGSNIFNLFAILGVAGLIAPTDVPWDVRFFYNPVMLVVTGAVVYLMREKKVISRGSGLLMLGCFAAYLWVSYLLS
jgi:cation:H+ antiporter